MPNQSFQAPLPDLAALGLVQSLRPGEPPFMARQIVKKACQLDLSKPAEVEIFVQAIIGLQKFPSSQKLYVALKEIATKEQEPTFPPHICYLIGSRFLSAAETQLQGIDWLSAAEKREGIDGEARQHLMRFFGEHKQENELCRLIESSLKASDSTALAIASGIARKWENQTKTNSVFTALEAGFQRFKVASIAELLASAYCYGHFGRFVDHGKAESLILEGVRPDSAFSKFLLGEIYSDRHGGLCDHQKAVDAYEQSFLLARDSTPPIPEMCEMAGLAFADLALRSSIVDNHTRAIDCLEELGEAGCAQAYLMLGIHYKNLGNFSEAKTSFYSGTHEAKGNPELERQICLELGILLHKDDPLNAAKMYRRAEELKSNVATELLAALLAFPDSLLHAPEQARDLLDNVKTASAMLLVGIAWEADGNYALCLRLFAAAAQEGELAAIYKLAEIHDKHFSSSFHSTEVQVEAGYAAYALYECLYRLIDQQIFTQTSGQLLRQWSNDAIPVLEIKLALASERLYLGSEARHAERVSDIELLAGRWDGLNILTYLKNGGICFMPGTI